MFKRDNFGYIGCVSPEPLLSTIFNCSASLENSSEMTGTVGNDSTSIGSSGKTSIFPNSEFRNSSSSSFASDIPKGTFTSSVSSESCCGGSSNSQLNRSTSDLVSLAMSDRVPV